MQSERHVRRLTAETPRALSGPQPLLNHTLVTWQRARYSNTSRNSNNVLAQHCPQAEHRNHRVNALIVIAILHLPLIAQWPTNCVVLPGFSSQAARFESSIFTTVQNNQHNRRQQTPPPVRRCCSALRQFDYRHRRKLLLGPGAQAPPLL